MGAKQTRGHLLYFTSSSYTRGRADYALYSSTKSAVVNLTLINTDTQQPTNNARFFSGRGRTFTLAWDYRF